ncbi:MAG: hypothetical protein R3B48_07710 [Kofleriaceae bacterium]
MPPRLPSLVASLSVLTLAPRAIADQAAPAISATATVERLAEDAAVSSVVRGAGATGDGFAVVTTSFDTVTDRAQLDLSGQVHLWDRLSLVLRVDDAASSDARPGVGAAIRLLDEGRHGVDSNGYLVYKTEGFSEPEGELEALASFGRSFGPVRAVANIAYGQDPEGNERDGEVALGVQMRPAPQLVAGVLGRYRDALGSRGDRGVLRDVFGGASATLALGRFAVSGLAGVSGIETTTSGSLQAGATAALSVGAAF